MLGKTVVGLVSVVLLMTGCGTLSTMTTGSLVMLKGAAPVVATATTKIEILLTPPKTPYEVVALVQASAHVSDTLYMAEYEAAALEELKKQTAKAGGEGIIEVTREVLAGGHPARPSL
ncbi:MAG: hypothetical protein FD130_2387 [Halothiobacillaceae bacterium]|nr:MAG: hypothetical protein FD130_2387 [Halothiobacillaceae bacterium]